jgi:hypothetical protein
VSVSTWRQRVTDALLAVSFFFIGFFSVSGDGAAGHAMTGLPKAGAPASAP